MVGGGAQSVILGASPAHPGVTPGVPGSGDQKVLYYWAPEGTFYTRLLHSRPGDAADLIQAFRQIQLFQINKTTEKEVNR